MGQFPVCFVRALRQEHHLAESSTLRFLHSYLIGFLASCYSDGSRIASGSNDKTVQVWLVE